MRKPIIGIDVDLTVVDSLQPWFDYSGVNLETSKTPYSINGSYGDFILENMDVEATEESDILRYWDLPNLYDNMVPHKGVCEFVHELSKEANVVFISVCQPAHKRSKEIFLERHFGDIPLVDTTNKYLVNVDMIIEDNLKVLHGFNIQRNNYGLGSAARIITDVSTKGHIMSLSGYSQYHEYHVPLNDFNENDRFVFDNIKLMPDWEMKHYDTIMKIARLASVGRISGKSLGYKPKFPVTSCELLSQ